MIFYNIWTQEGQKYHIIWYKLVLKCCCCRRYCCWHCCSCSFSCCCRCQNRCALVAVVVVVVPVVSSLPFWNQFVSNMWYFCLHCIQILKKSRTYYFLTSPFKVWNETVTLDLTKFGLHFGFCIVTLVKMKIQFKYKWTWQLS